MIINAGLKLPEFLREDQTPEQARPTIQPQLWRQNKDRGSELDPSPLRPPWLLHPAPPGPDRGPRSPNPLSR